MTAPLGDITVIEVDSWMAAPSAGAILADLVANVVDQGDVQFGRGLHRAAARRILDRARDYVEAHLDEAIRVASMCRYAGTTLRSLERVFVREMGMSPQQYVACLLYTSDAADDLLQV